MGMNIYKLATFVLLINIVFGMGVTLGDYNKGYEQQKIDALEKVNDQILTSDGHYQTLSDDDSKVSTTQDILTIGSGIKWTGIIKDIFINGLNQISLTKESISDSIGKGLVILLTTFRMIIGLFLTIKVILVIKNKDTQ